MLKLDNNPDLLETIKQSNPKLKKIAMSVAETLRQEGEQMGLQKGKIEGRIEGKIEIAKAMLKKCYPIEDIMLLTGLSRSCIEDLLKVGNTQ
ncbi:MAG: hypothetical protein NMK33_03655 [Candidatus Cardinium sp.]|uniref:hypothetical protein n=1 Tax=Cardinium endosymbiont of Dermatophagoides farinae TaxID=2597823 RepID=UPI001CB8EA99|nr:hypothetical protein [Cardinium endosymbiont of Dermatophagoides farinae]UWW96529.1 MAG: hypothetical protein NMK33_03655 [Candidatus Cardinium sp.]